MKIHMKTKQIICMICLLTLLTGCSDPSSDSTGSVTTDSEYVTIGSSLTVHNTDTRLTLLSNMDALSADGLYYASWTAGSSEPYENSDGDTVDLYDAQLYLLLGEFKSSESAQSNMENWLTAGRTNYDVTDERNITCNGQSYTIVAYNFSNEGNPYARGVSAFGVSKNLAICVELTCRDNYQEDLDQMLTDFLNGCSYK